MSQNDGQRRLRTLSGVHGSACFSLLGPVAASLADGGGIRQKVCEHVGCKQVTTRLCGASTCKGMLSGPCSLLGATCYHTTAEDALLSEGSLKFIKV